MSKHTPGPWSFKPFADAPIGPVVVRLEDNFTCGDPNCCGPPSYSIEISEADGLLIAAAPDLLESLVRMTEYAWMYADLCDETGGVLETHISTARAAIAKATGETQ